MRKVHFPTKGKIKAFAVSAFFVFSFFLMFIMVSSCEPDNVSLGAVAKRFAIAIVLLAVNVVVINRNFVDGEWRFKS